MVSVGVSNLAALKSIYRATCQSEWTIATTFFHRSYCQTYSEYPRVSILVFDGTEPRRIEHATPSLSWSERYSTSCLQHCGRRIHRILTQSTIASVVYCRRKFPHHELLTSINSKRVWSTSGNALTSRSWMLASCCYSDQVFCETLCNLVLLCLTR